jgi:creatinine amidohydrolase
MMMVIRKDLVKGLPEEHFPPRPRFLIMRDVRGLMGNGIMGNPAPATIKKGQSFLAMAAEGLIEALEELESDCWKWR